MKNSPALLGVVLAGGQSRRMSGHDKHQILLGGKTLLTHVTDRLDPLVDNLIINSNNENISDAYKVVPDIESHLGPIGGLYSALKYASENGYDQIVTTPCDTPFVPENYVDQLKKGHAKSCTIVGSGDRLHPVLGLWDVAVLNDVKASIEEKNLKLMTLLENIDHTICRWPDEPDPFFNINKPEDVKIAESRLKSLK